MTSTKFYEKAVKLFDENANNIAAFYNAPDGMIFTIDKYVAFFVPGHEVLTAYLEKFRTCSLEKLYNIIWEKNYIMGKKIPGKLGSRNVIKIGQYQGKNAYFFEKYAKYFPKNALFYTVPDGSGDEPIVVGLFENQFKLIGVIAPIHVPDESHFERIDAK